MDYDGSDFQSQNFQLGGEDNKFPPGLQSYALPKFDLDEHLHLRFDSLVETEDLLGIQSQEKNHWIEDFSRGSSGIEFSSSAAESCSISMRNNVWSEATSSESVEMLLKSVGDDEMITKKNINEESRVCEGLDSLDNQMDLSLHQDDSLPSRIGGAIDTVFTLPPDKGLKSSSGSSKDAAGPRSQQDEDSGFENLGDLDPSSSSEKYETHANVAAEHCNLDQNKTSVSVEKSSQGDHGYAAFGMTGDSPDNNAMESMEVDPLAASVKDSVVGAGVLNAEKIPQEGAEGCSGVVFSNKPAGLLKDDVQTGEIGIFSKGALMYGQHGEEQRPTDGYIDEEENASSLALNADFSVQKIGHGKDVLSEKPVELLKADNDPMESGVSRKDTEMSDDFMGSTHDTSLILMEGKKNIEHGFTGSSNNDVANLSSSLSKVNSINDTIHDAQETVLIEDGHGCLGIHSAEDSEFAVIGKKVLDKVSGTDQSKSDVSLTESGYVIPEQAHCLHDFVSVNRAELHVLSSLHGKSSQSYDSNPLGGRSGDALSDNSDVSIVNKENVGLSGRLDDAHSDNSDVSLVDKENAGLSVSPHNIGTEIDDSLILEKRAETTSRGESTTTMTANVCGSQGEQSIGDASVSTGIVLGGVAELASLSKSGENKQVTYEIAEQKVGMSLVPISGFVNSDRKEVSGSGTSTEACASGDGNSHISNKPIRVSDSGQHSVSNSPAELLPEMGVQSLASVDKSIHSLCQNEPQTSLVIMTTENCDQGLEGHSTAHVSVMKELDGGVLGVSSKEYEVAALNITGDTSNCHEETSFKPLPSSENSAELHPVEAESGNLTSDEPNCGSPTTITCSEPSESKKECQEGGDNAPSHQNVPISNEHNQIPSDIHTHANYVKSTAHEPKDSNASEVDRSFTFEVGSLADLSERETDKGWKPFSSVQPFVLSQTREGSATSGLGNADPKNVQVGSRESHQVSDVQKVHVGTKAINVNKTKSASGTASEKKTSTQEKAAKKSSHQKKTTEKDFSPFSASTKFVGISRPMPVEELRQYSCIEGSSMKTSCVPTVQASNLPDLNSSALTISHQPFSDLQQVQLRAQIFVYGSLIQGTPPDEACMISAFGETTSRDSGKSLWENVWRLAVEKFHNQKLPLSNPETPIHPRSGPWASEQVSRSTPLQSKTHSTTAGRTGNKGASSAIASSVMSLSPPLWNISTPSRDGLQSSTMPRGPFLDSHQSLSSLHPYQSPHMRHYVGSAHWPSQSPCPVPWVVSPQPSAIDTNVQFSALPIAEAVQVTSVRDSSVPRASNMQLAPSSPLVTAGVSVSVPAGTAVSMEAKTTTTSSGKHVSVDQKSRKRKKNLISEELGRISSVTLPRTEPTFATDVAKNLTSSVAISPPAHPESRATFSGIVPTSSPIACSTHFQVVVGSDMNQRVVFSDETFSRIEQAKLHAEDASAVAAAAVKNSQGIWSQLAMQKSSGLVSEVEVKLASAAVAAAAAASVAKAAAAAAKVASDAALQAKLMADEAMSMSKMGNSIQASETCLPNSGKNLGMMSPASILKGVDKTNSSNPIIVAARETARKRVEAASAAAKRAEILDAVVKAAELAAEAVSQAGILIAMGDPIPLTLSELAEAGPEGYWRVPQVSSEQVKQNGMRGERHSNVDGSDQGLDRPAKRPSYKKGTLRTSDEGNVPSKEVASLPVGNRAGLVNGMHWDSVSSEKGLGGALVAQNDEYERHQQAGMSMEKNIMEGSDVEVISDEDGLRGVWFSAKVLSLKDGQAYVCHKQLLQGEGPEKLKEWISLEGEANKAPRIRVAHPVTAMKFEGTRKRRRAAMGNYVWSVGDRVDAWMRDGWWEGVVTEKNKEDETKLTVQFSAGGESSAVRPWNLRPSLVWKDGQWMEWSRENNSSRHEGDTPQDKRQKLSMLEVEVGPQVDVAGGEDKLSRIPCNEDTKRPEEARSLMLSEKDRIFSVGKVVTEVKNSNALKMKRTGLQKEGSRVVFGIPKPGKKRKFMEVSKHYVADRAPKMSEGTDSIKFAKYLMPQGSRGLKSTSKVDLKGKATVDLKPKVLKSGKAHGIQGKSMSEKNNSSMSVVTTSSDGAGQDPLLNSKSFSLHHEKNRQNMLEAGYFSSSLKAAEGPVICSSLGLATVVPSSKKKPSSAVGPELGTKGKRVPSGEKYTRDEEKSSDDNLGRTNPDAIEPRRSNRRIQPTSRLLEGLQSSLIISKIPPVSHDKGVKAQHRSGSSSRGNNHG